MASLAAASLAPPPPPSAAPAAVQLVVSSDGGISAFGAPSEAAFLRGDGGDGSGCAQDLPVDETLSWHDPGAAAAAAAQSAKSAMLHGVSAPKICHSEDGRVLAVTTSQGVTFQHVGRPIDAAAGVSIAVDNVDFVSLSPKGTYFVAWSRVYKGDKGAKNLRVWRVADRALVAALVCPRQPADEKWPLIKFAADESFAARAVSNEVHFFDGCDLAAPPTSKIRLPKVHLFSISPGAAPQRVCCFALDAKGQPGRCNMYRMGQLDRVIVSKSFFRAEECVFHWSPNGNTVLVETHSSVDATGQSYMGESNLFLLSDRPGNAWSMKVPRTKDGPLHAVKWNPSGKEFAVIAGSIPPNVTLYNPRTGDPVFELGAAPRNTLSYSPQGRFLMCAGFGTMRGDMDFWDIYKRKKMGPTTRSKLAVVDYGWSADGRWFQTAATYPRRQMETGYAVYGYTGELVALHGDGEGVFKKLFKVFWRPVPADSYPDRPADKAAVERSLKDGEGADGGVGGAGGAGGTSSGKRQGYRPPGARARGGGGGRSLSDMLGERTSTSGAIKKGALEARGGATSGPIGSQVVGGAAGAAGKGGKNAAKNKARKERQRRAKEAAELKRQAEEAAAKEAEAKAAEEAAAKEADPSLLSPEERKKKVKKLKKQLRGIDALKAKDQSSLNDAQRAKLAGEGALKEKLAALEGL
jgi:translation initiation factor 2A